MGAVPSRTASRMPLAPHASAAPNLRARMQKPATCRPRAPAELKRSYEDWIAIFGRIQRHGRQIAVAGQAATLLIAGLGRRATPLELDPDRRWAALRWAALLLCDLSQRLEVPRLAARHHLDQHHASVAIQSDHQRGERPVINRTNRPVLLRLFGVRDPHASPEPRTLFPAVHLFTSPKAARVYRRSARESVIFS